MKRSNIAIVLALAVFTSLLALAPAAMAEVTYPKLLLKAEALNESLGAPELRIIDCRTDPAMYAAGHIPGAVYYNVSKDLRVKSAGGVVGVRRHQEEQDELFGRTLGISGTTMVVLYDESGYDATRLFWELTQAGHDKVAILYGGWPEWVKKAYPVSKDAVAVTPVLFVSRPRPELLATASYILENMANPKVVFYDARKPEEFKGTAVPAIAPAGGHIPGAVNLFTLTSWTDKTYLKPIEELEAVFADLGITRDKTIISYCNTGYFASNGFFVLKALGYPDVRVYDFSWAEWGNKDYLPKIK